MRHSLALTHLSSDHGHKAKRGADRRGYRLHLGFNRRLFLWGVLALTILAGCSPHTVVATIEHGSTQAVLEEPSQPGEALQSEGLSESEIKTLASLRKVDEYPLYSMHYYGNYARSSGALEADGLAEEKRMMDSGWVFRPRWGCSLFAALGDEANMTFGRNFDWDFSPALLLYADPMDGYASVSMVDLAYFGFTGEQSSKILDMPLAERAALLETPRLPFDGMNEHGLVVGMAAVPEGNMTQDPGKPTIGSIEVIREMLDHARDVEQAIRIFESHNIDMAGGPPIHYLIADASGQSALIEFYQGERIVLRNHRPWHLATNFLRASMDESSSGACWRYDRIESKLLETGGMLTAREALELLQSVSQDGTQWSVVYGISTREVQVVMGRAFARVYTFRIANKRD